MTIIIFLLTLAAYFLHAPAWATGIAAVATVWCLILDTRKIALSGKVQP